MKKLFLILALLLVAIVAFAQHIDAKKFILNCSQSWGVTSEQIVQTKDANQDSSGQALRAAHDHRSCCWALRTDGLG